MTSSLFSFFYLSSLSRNGNAAHKIQISNMVSSFSKRKDIYFLCIDADSFSLRHHYHFHAFKKIFTVLLVVFTFLRASRRHSGPIIVYTRELPIALLLSFLGFNCFLETHTYTRKNSIIFALISELNRFRSFSIVFVFISDALRSRFKPSLQCGHFHSLVLHDSISIVDSYARRLPLDYSLLFSSLRSEYEFIICHTGSLSRGGLEYLIDLIPEYPECCFLFLGTSIPDFCHYASISTDDIPCNVRLLGWATHSVSISVQQSSDILLYLASSRNKDYWCTSPMKIFEYMLARKHIISAKTSSISEIGNEQHFFFYDIDSAESMDTALAASLLAIKKSDYTLPLKAYQHVTSSFTWDARVSRIVDLATQLY
ncbi:glycosyltransferase [Synechococcus sp. BS56D]|uniref:glycosyltransferase n=1 Tax=Synechococcus sp. BS56D TaxID=2055944 RepID=UPI00103994F0|nr:glycosyltransferase [Synechococcus sp. BS56D]